MYTYSVFCEAPTIFRSFRQVRRKVVGVFLFLAPEPVSLPTPA